ncbi:MAG: rhomboid family intramembrane serine protease [Rubripirellula sp.]|jgi:GlpG protein|nr:rhomboid family intramembrane serine protease [Planctomycetaceae bacterium]MDF1840694.1 rhomboid family intramembrane serine protease [Rubripirellula sp.]
MRRIGTLPDESSARKLADFLVTQSILSTIDHDESDGSWSIWVRDEQQVEVAKREFASFQQDQNSPRYQVEEKAKRIRDERDREEKKRQAEQEQAIRSMPVQQQMLDRPGLEPLAGIRLKQRGIPATITLIVISIIVSLTSHFGSPRPKADGTLSLEQRTYLLLSFVDRRDWSAEKQDPYASVRKGQWWRMITPMFMHGDEFHLAFNMLWLFFLGSVIERLHGSWFLLLLTFGTEIAGTLLQVSLPTADWIPQALQGSPFAIGASGAVYGLFGFLWIRPAVDPTYPVHLVPMNVILMLVWLVACMTPLVPNVANGAHLGGLMGGIFFALAGRALAR